MTAHADTRARTSALGLPALPGRTWTHHAWGSTSVPAAPAQDGAADSHAPRDWLVLLHGFLGTRADWASALTAVCAALPAMWPGAAPLGIAVLDLPGHGAHAAPGGAALSIAGQVAWLDTVLARLGAHIGTGGTGGAGQTRVWLAGYSMGGRVCLHHIARGTSGTSRAESAAARGPATEVPALQGVTAVCASAGLSGDAARLARASVDDARAAALRSAQDADGNITSFIESWYQAGLFASLRAHPGFTALKARRAQQDGHAMARVIAAASPGRTPVVAGAVARAPVPLVLYTGRADAKYTAQHDALYAARTAAAAGPTWRVHGPGGHAALTEAPRAVADAILCMLSARAAPAFPASPARATRAHVSSASHANPVSTAPSAAGGQP